MGTPRLIPANQDFELVFARKQNPPIRISRLSPGLRVSENNRQTCCVWYPHNFLLWFELKPSHSIQRHLSAKRLTSQTQNLAATDHSPPKFADLIEFKGGVGLY
jgi:hypothetical protein